MGCSPNLEFYVEPDSYAHEYVKIHGYNFSFLSDPNSQPNTQYLNFSDEYQYLKIFDTRSLSELSLNYSADIPFVDISFSVSNDSVAIISDGKIVGIGEGTCTVTATYGNLSTTCTVIVNEIPLTSISLKNTQLDLAYGDSSNMAVTYAPSNTTDNKTVTWTSSNISVASVDVNGKVTATGTGTATITATVGSCSEQCIVYISKAVSSYTVPTGLSATYGDTLEDVALPEAPNGTFAWTENAMTPVGNWW